jgi:aconitate hydratase
MASSNPFEEKCHKTFDVNGTTYNYYSIKALEDPRVARLPYCIRVLLECAVRNCDEFEFKGTDVENILNWETTSN